MEADVSFFFKEKNLKDIAEIKNFSEILICSNVFISDELDKDFEEYKENKNIFVKIKKLTVINVRDVGKFLKINFKMNCV